MPQLPKLTKMDVHRLTAHIRLIERTLKLAKDILAKNGAGKLAWAVGVGLVVTSILNCPCTRVESMVEFRRATFQNTDWGSYMVPRWRWQ